MITISKKKHYLNNACYTSYFSKTLLILAFFISVLPTIAQEIQENNKNWNFTVAPYIIFPNMNGDVGMGGVRSI